MPITKENLKDAFTYHVLDDVQLMACKRVEDATLALANVALEVLGPCGDQQAALRLLFEAKATLNRGIAIRGQV